MGDRAMALNNDSRTHVAERVATGWIATASVIRLLVILLPVFLLTSPIGADQRGVRVEIKDKQGQLVGLYKESHALLIGVSNYTAGWADLENVPRELDLVETTLKRHGFNVVKRLNPTGHQLKQAFEGFVDKYGYDSQNRLLFYFAGHGYTRSRGERGYLVPANAPHPQRDELGFLRNALSMIQILAWSRLLEAKHALFLFDSCFSGPVFKAKSLPDRPANISQITSKPVRQYITACGVGEQVPARSIFTAAFVDALKYGLGDLNADGYVTGMELGRYLQGEVPKHVSQKPQFGKAMDYKLSRGDFVFVVDSSPVTNAKLQGRLWVKTDPENARVRILNIKPKYTPGIALQPSRYFIEVFNPGYRMQRKWITLAEGEDKYVTVRLRPSISESTVTVEFTVAGRIQTDDPWTKGERSRSEWAKPMYRIWFDGNGNPNDGGWNNGQGPRQAEVWLDSGRLGFHWNGKDGKPNTGDDLHYWPIAQSSINHWIQGGIDARLSSDGRSFRVSLPLKMMGSPQTLEVSFMTSPWTSDASDNLGPGADSRPAWIAVSDTEKARVYAESDARSDNRWPSLTPDRRANFDLLEAEVRISMQAVNHIHHRAIGSTAESDGYSVSQ
jgi:hypothetical protein